MVFLYQNQRHTIYPGTMYKIVISFLFFSFVTSCKHHAVNILGNALGMGNPSRFKKNNIVTESVQVTYEGIIGKLNH
jgi:hypothetical protein